MAARRSSGVIHDLFKISVFIVSYLQLFTCVSLALSYFFYRNTEYDLLQYDSYVLTNVVGQNFITCWATTHKDFQVFAKPFMHILWIVLFCTVVTMVVLFNLYVRAVYPKLYKSTSYSSQLLFIAYLFEESLPIYSELLNDRNFRIVFGTWLLVSVVVTQGTYLRNNRINISLIYICNCENNVTLSKSECSLNSK